jgi:glycine hydroxymethyltransferase
MSHFSGLVAGGVYPNPINQADFVTSTTHKTLRGPRGGIILSKDDQFKKEINRAVFPGQQGGALGQTIAAKALAFELASRPSWHQYAREVVSNASAMANRLKEKGLKIISHNKTHLFLIDLEGKSGKEAEERLENMGIVTNRNTIPFDSRSAKDPSGLRLGSAALTTRGLKEDDFIEVADLINLGLSGIDVSGRVRQIANRFPVN